MTLTPTPEQEELRNSASRFFADTFSSAVLRALVDSGKGVDDRFFEQCEELGLFSFFSGELGEAGHIADLTLIAIEAGRHLVPGNLVGALLAGPCVESGIFGEKGSFSRLMSKEVASMIATGRRRVTLVPHPMELSSSDTVSGVISNLPDVDPSGYLLIISPKGKVGVIENGAVKFQSHTSLDLTLRLYETTFINTPCRVLKGIDGNSLRAAERVLRAAEMAGVAHRAVSMTTEYVKTRKQFGAPIGSFQGVQHQLAEIFLKAEAMDSLSRFAGWALDASPEQRDVSARSAQIYSCENGPSVVETALQLHGGIGFTWEYDLHLFLRRARWIEAVYGPGETGYDDLLGAAAAFIR